MGSISQVASREPNPALNPAPFSRWTLRDKAAQRRLALRYASRLYFASSKRRDCSQTLPPSSITVHCDTFARSPRHDPRTNGSQSDAALRDGYALPTLVQPFAGCITIEKNTVRFSISSSPRITRRSTRTFAGKAGSAR